MRRLVACALLTTTTIVLVCLTVARTAVYHSRIGMWTDVVAKSPRNPRAQFSLGVALLRQDEKANADRALHHFDCAIDVLPTHVNAHNNAGTIRFRRGEFAAAAAHYRAAASADRPGFQSLNNYGSALLQLQQYSEAATVLELALHQMTREKEHRAKEPRLRNNLGFCYAQRSDWQKAITQFQLALELDPELKEAQDNLLRAVVAQSRAAPPDKR